MPKLYLFLNYFNVSGISHKLFGQTRHKIDYEFVGFSVHANVVNISVQLCSSAHSRCAIENGL